MERIYAALNDDDKLAVDVIKNCQCKKHSKETQTLHAGCSVIFAPPQTPFPGAQESGRPKFNQLEMVTTFTYKPSLVKIDARNFELSW